MGLFGLFKKKSDETKVGNVEDFISLTRVYFQSVIATNLGITNIRFLPDVANFKRLFKVPTQNGKLGLAEKSASRKMLMQDYGLSENFFKEIDASVKKHCRTQNDVQASACSSHDAYRAWRSSVIAVTKWRPAERK